MDEISFSISNGSAMNTIYMPTSDPSVNNIKVLISSTTPLSLIAGSPVEQSQAASASGTLLYLHLASLGLSSSALNDLEVSLSGWNAKVFADTQVLCLAPQQNGLLAQGQLLVVTIGGFTAGKAPSGSSAQLFMDYYRAAPVSSGSLPFTYSTIVALQAPPSGNLDLHDALAVTLNNNTVVQSTTDYPSIANTLSLAFGPGANPKLITAGKNTVFTINFVYANDSYGYGALTTIDDAFDIGVAAGDQAGGWTITPPPAGAQNPGWMLQPPPGQPILNGATVGFALSNIMTRFQPGATLMLVSYSGVPGYQDGAFSVVLYKEAHVYVHALEASPNPAVLDDGEAQVTLSWQATGKRLTLMPGMIDVTGSNKYTATIGSPTQFTLIAQGASAPNYATGDVQAEIFPAINSIAASPQLVYYSDFPHTVLLDWSVNSNDQVALSSSVNKNPQFLPPDYTTAVTISQPQCFTLTPKSGLPLYIERKEVISAFRLQQQTLSLSSTPVALAVSPHADICALLSQGSNQIQVMETISNTMIGNPINAGSNPVALAFSPDGSMLFVANGGDSTLSVFAVTLDAESGAVSLDKSGSDVKLSGVPVAVQVAASGNAVFVTSNNSNTKPGALDVVTCTNGIYSTTNTVRFPKQVGTLAVLPSSAQIFIASQAGQAVYVAGYDSIHHSYQLVRTIGGFAASDKVRDVAIAGQDAGTLLVACSGSNVVYAIDRKDASVAGTQCITVGSNPARLLVVQGGAYAYVANTGDNSLSLISCFKGSGLCTLLEASLANKAAPAALAASAEGSLVYVANSASSLSIWNAQTMTPQGDEVSATLPTSVVANDQYVVSWHNYNVQFSVQGKTPTPGLSVYDRNSETSSVVNNSVQYTTFGFWPDSSRNLAIATAYGDNNLYMLNTRDFSTATRIAFSQSTTCRAVSTAISPFGNMIFVLAVDAGAYQLSAISCNLDSKQYKLVSTVKLFTQSVSSSHALAAVSDGTSAFITDSASAKLYVVTRQKDGTYALEGNSYAFPAMPRAMNCAPDDSQLYVWMNQSSNSGFARFDIATRTLRNLILPPTVQFQVSSMAIAPDGSRLYMTDTNMGGVRVFSTGAMQNVENIMFPNASFPMGVAVAPDGSGVFTANALSGTMSVASQLAASPELRARYAERSQGGSYSGIFLRDYIGETPTSGTGTGWTLSPDIVPYGTQAMLNPSQLGLQANYNTDYSNNITLDMYNNVYVRGLNTNAGSQTSRIYMYWADSSIILTPSQWMPYNFTFDSNLQNWLDVTAEKNGDIAYSTQPISWKPSSRSPHYCLIAWVDNSATPSPPDLSQFANFTDWTALGNFIMTHPNICWRNTNDVNAPAAFMNAQTMVTGVTVGGQITVGLQMSNIPTGTDGTIQFTLVNSDGTISYNSPTHKIDTNTFSETFNWQAGVKPPMLTYTYVPATGTKLNGTESITAFSALMPSQGMRKRLLLRAPETLIEIPHGKLGAVTAMVLGTVRFKYTGQ